MQPDSVPTISATDPSATTLRRIVRYLIAGNPFFILSAVLLLYAMRRLSFDSRLFSTELSQLVFNFGSFQFYEVLLAGTAIVLARHRIWYDSTLLVFIENLFAFVPLILVSQALLVENSVAATLCTVGAVLFAVRTGALARFIRPLNFPPRLLAFALLLLAVNVAAPVLTRHLHRDLTLAKWDDVATRLANIEWFFVLPLMCVLALFLPRRSKDSPAYFSRTEFPLFTVLLWITGTAVHFYCINFVYGLPAGALRISVAAPALWIACWVLWVRAEDVKWSSQNFGRLYENVLLSASVATLAFPAMSDDRLMLLSLGAVNVVLFSVLSFKSRSWFNILLLTVSGAMTAAALHTGLRTTHVELDFGNALWIAIGGFLLVRSILSRDPRFAFLGGFLASIIAARFFNNIDALFAVTGVGLSFVVVHSIFWNDALDPHSKGARTFATCLWVANSVALLESDFAMSYWHVFISGLAVFLVALAVRSISGSWLNRLIPFAALGTIALPVAFKSCEMLQHASSGLLTLLASFLLFAVGIMTALMRSRWLARATDCRVVPNI
jgi:hypothetical protein